MVCEVSANVSESRWRLAGIANRPMVNLIHTLQPSARRRAVLSRRIVIRCSTPNPTLSGPGQRDMQSHAPMRVSTGEVAASRVRLSRGVHNWKIPAAGEDLEGTPTKVVLPFEAYGKASAAYSVRVTALPSHFRQHSPEQGRNQARAQLAMVGKEEP